MKLPEEPLRSGSSGTMALRISLLSTFWASRIISGQRPVAALKMPFPIAVDCSAVKRKRPPAPELRVRILREMLNPRA